MTVWHISILKVQKIQKNFGNTYMRNLGILKDAEIEFSQWVNVNRANLTHFIETAEDYINFETESQYSFIHSQSTCKLYIYIYIFVCVCPPQGYSHYNGRWTIDFKVLLDDALAN